MKHLLLVVLASLIVAAVWGYFADLRNGQVGWFASRLVFVPVVTVGVMRVFQSWNAPRGKKIA